MPAKTITKENNIFRAIRPYDNKLPKVEKRFEKSLLSLMDELADTITRINLLQRYLGEAYERIISLEEEVESQRKINNELFEDVLRLKTGTIYKPRIIPNPNPTIISRPVTSTPPPSTPSVWSYNENDSSVRTTEGFTQGVDIRG